MILDQQDWKIPPSISNWKNPKGYTIPLDKRLAADGRNLQDVVVNDKFAALSEDLYLAERKAQQSCEVCFEGGAGEVRDEDGQSCCHVGIKPIKHVALE